MNNDNTPRADQRQPLIGMTLKELEEVAAAGHMPRFVAKQLAQWLYDKKVDSFDQMVNI